MTHFCYLYLFDRNTNKFMLNGYDFPVLSPEIFCLTPLFFACNTLRMNGILIFIHNRFEEQEAPGSRSFFTEIIASISDVKFARDGRYLLSRDCMTLKVLPFVYFCT